MADTRQQIKSFIRKLITDPYNQQNSAEKVRAALEYMTDNLSNPADDDIGAGVRWINQPEAGTPVVTDGLVTVPLSGGRGYFNGATITFEPESFTGIPLAASGLQRQDIIVGFADGTLQYVAGDDAANPVTPAVPDGALQAASILINDAGVIVEVPDNGITVVDKVEAANLNATTSNAVFKALLGGLYKPYSYTKAYEVGETYRGTGGLYKVLIAWPASSYIAEYMIPRDHVELIANLDTPNYTQLASGSITGKGYYATYSNFTIDLTPHTGTTLNITPGDAIRKGKRLNLRLIYNGSTAITTNATISGNISIPSAAVAGDVVVLELFAFADNTFTLVRKYIEGKESGTGSGTMPEPTENEAGSATLNFHNPAGIYRDPLTQEGALPFVLGTGPNKVGSIIWQPVQVVTPGAITFDANFKAYQRFIGFTPGDSLPVGLHIFHFAFTPDGVSVSVPGYMPEGETGTGGGTVDTVNNQVADVNKNVLLEGQHIYSLANLWSYIGLVSSSATISLKGWLDFLTNKVKTNEEQIALRVKTILQGGTTYTPDANGQVSLPAAGSSIVVEQARSQSTTAVPSSKLVDDELKLKLNTDEEDVILTPDGSNAVVLTMDNNKNARIAGNVTPATITFSGTHKRNKYRVLTIVGNGSITPAITGATADPMSFNPYKVASGALNRLMVYSDSNASGILTIYYYWV